MKKLLNLIPIVILILGIIVYLQRKQLNHTVTIYTPIDILYINYGDRVIEFESPLTPPHKFKTYEGMLMYIEDITAEHSNSVINHE